MIDQQTIINFLQTALPNVIILSYFGAAVVYTVFQDWGHALYMISGFGITFAAVHMM